MRVLLFLFPAIPSLAFAALPVLSTDTLAPGESALGMSAGQTQDRADLLFAQGATSVPGNGHVDATSFGGNWSYGPARNMEIGLSAGHTQVDRDETFHGVNTVEEKSRVAGWEDLSWYTQWRFSDDEKTAWSVVASGVVPTASDGQAVPETLVNGVVKPPPARDGSPGRGYSLFSLAGLASHRYGQDALEGAVSWTTDDNSHTADNFSIGGSYVHFLDTAGSRASIGISEILYGAYDNGAAQTPGHNATRIGGALAWRPKPDIDVSASINYTRYDTVTTLYPLVGRSMQDSGEYLVGYGVGIRVLMP